MGFSRPAATCLSASGTSKEGDHFSQHQTVMNKHFCCVTTSISLKAPNWEAGEHQVCGHPNLGARTAFKERRTLQVQPEQK